MHDSSHDDPPPRRRTDRHGGSDDLVGTIVSDRYEVHEELGTGGMSTVYLARHLGLSCDVAIKVLDPHLARRRGYTARFKREAESLSRLDHPNCLRVLDFCVTSEGLHVLATELVDGLELRELAAEPQPIDVVVDRMLQILAGLQHAHDCGVVHRDLKAENILVTSDAEGREHLKIVDFGIAKLVDAPQGSHQTAAGVIFGTPQYMSPEQAAGKPIDHRTDLYAAGVLMYLMLAGEKPFDDDDPAEVLRMQINEPPPPLPDDVPRPIVDVVMRLLSKRPEDRYPSARAVIDALRRAGSEDEEPAAAPERAPLQMRTLPPAPMPRRRSSLVRWAPFAAAALLLTGGAIVHFSEKDRDAAESGATTERLREMTAQDAEDLLARGRPAEAREVVTVLIDDAPDDPRLAWTLGKVLVAQHDHERALAEYARAASLDDDLLDDPKFFAELDALMRRDDLRDAAIDVALRDLDSAADDFLYELVVRDPAALDYVPRHRILHHFEETDGDDRIDLRAHAQVDLRQAAGAPDPCAAYLHGLSVLTTAPRAEDLAAVAASTVPAAPKEGAAACTEAASLRRALLDVLEAQRNLTQPAAAEEGQSA